MKQLLNALLLCLPVLCTKAQDIVPNPSFGDHGFVFKSAGTKGNIRYEKAMSAIQLPDKKFLLGVEANDGSALLIRYLPDGSLDKTYGTDGYSQPFGAYQTHAVRTTEGKVLVAGRNGATHTDFVIARFDQNGNLDKSFGKNGVKTIWTEAFRMNLAAFTLQKDGKLLLGGGLTYGGNKTEAFVLRLLENGSPDATFGERGFLTVEAQDVNTVTSFAVNDTAIIVGTGYDDNGTGGSYAHKSHFVVLKYKVDGTPDANFGESGLARVDIGADDLIETIALQYDGKIIAAGETGNAFYDRENFAMIRLSADGKQDGSFNQTGVFTTTFGAFNHSLRTLLFDANGGINVSVGTKGGSGAIIGFARFDKDGNPDNTFGEGGKKLWNFGQSSANINAGFLKDDGSFIGAGLVWAYADPNATMDYMQLHLTAEGQPDEGFGSGGVLTSYLPVKVSSFGTPKLLSDGKILAPFSANGSSPISGLIRYLPDGSVDEGFAEKGFLNTSYYFFDLLPDNRVVTFVNIYNNTTFTSKAVMRRFTYEGLPDYTFGDNGQKELPLYRDYSIYAIKSLPDGKILLTGYYTTDNFRQQGFLVRLNSDGSRDDQFGNNEEVLLSLERSEFVQQLVVQPDGKILVGGFSITPPTYSEQFFVRRFSADGQPDKNFGNKGVIDGSYGSYTAAYLLSVQPNGKLLVTYITTLDDIEYSTYIQRYGQNGLPDESFGDNGRVKLSVYDAEVLQTGKLLLVTYIKSQVRSGTAFMLLNPNGSVDKSFGVNGIKFLQPGENANILGFVRKDEKLYFNGGRSVGLDAEGYLGGLLIKDKLQDNFVSGFTLVRASSGKDIGELKEGSVINLDSLPTGGLNIRANTTPETTASVVFKLQGPKTISQTESLLPYALFGDDQKGGYYSGLLPAGEYTLTATPYDKAGGKGSAGAPLTIHFKVVYSAAVTRFALVNAATGKDVRKIDEGDALDMYSLPAKLNIRAYTTPSRVGSVVVELSGTKEVKQTQNGAPYTLFGDENGNYFSGNLPPGEYTLTATPYSEQKGKGINGKSLIIHFKVDDPTIVHLLYGLTTDGGVVNTGVLFSLNAATSVYTKLKDIGGFDGRYTGGNLSQGRDGKLYGMATQGGNLPYGSIFSFDPQENKFTSLAEFNSSNGSVPKGRLVQAGDGKFYGMTANGTTGYGNIFSFDPTTTAITSLKEFNYGDGFSPNGSLVEASNGKLYGMTPFGGNNQFGVLFSFDPATNEYVKLLDFGGAVPGTPYGSLIQASDGKLYGMTYGGVIFSFDPATNILTGLKYFSGADGRYPWGDLVQAKDGKLYGMTNEGGSNNLGVFFSFNPVTNEYNKLLDFNGANGRNSLCTPMQASNGKIYGETTLGGSSDLGVLFSFDPVTNTFVQLKDFSGSDGAYPGYTSLIELSCKGTLYYRDADKDGYGDPATTISECFSSVPDGYVTNKDDCNDGDASVHPGAIEICGNGIDENCNGLMDEGCTTDVSFRLLKPLTGEDVGELKEGSVVNLNNFPSGRLNIRANTTPVKVGSVVFLLQGPLTKTQTENVRPYALFGDDQKGSYYGASLPVGDYTLTATPFSAAGGDGAKGVAATIHFTVVNSLPFMTRTDSKGGEVTLNANKELSLLASPNPFSDATAIRFSVPENGYATLRVCDLSGRTVAHLFQGVAKGGSAFQTTFSGKGLPGGVYLILLTVGTKTVQTKVTMIH